MLTVPFKRNFIDPGQCLFLVNKYVPSQRKNREKLPELYFAGRGEIPTKTVLFFGSWNIPGSSLLFHISLLFGIQQIAGSDSIFRNGVDLQVAVYLRCLFCFRAIRNFYEQERGKTLIKFFLFNFLCIISIGFLFLLSLCFPFSDFKLNYGTSRYSIFEAD